MLISRVLRVENRQSTALISINFEVIVCAFIVLLFVHVAHSTSLSSSNSGSNGNGGIGGGPKTFYIHWNTSNSVFRIDNTDHIYDINRGNSRFEYDQMNIVCPVYQRPSPSSSAALQQQPNEDEMEKYIIYNVSKEEYETCRITNPNPRIIAICDKPYKLMYFTITFRPFTPQPGGLEFLPGHDYYFISTSSKDDLHRRIGGRCSTNNMKVLFKVWHPQEGPEHPNPTSGVTLSNETSWPPPPHHPPLLQPDASPSPSYSATQADNIHIDNKVPITQPPILTSRPTKKSKTYTNHPNDVEKSSLTGSADSVFSVSAGTMLLISLCIMLR